MIRQHITNKANNKENASGSRTISEFKFFSKPSGVQSECVYNISRSINETKNWSLKSLKLEKLRDLIQNTPVSKLITFMKSDDEIVRSIAAQSFAECGSATLLNCLNMMLEDESENLRLATVESLTHLNSMQTLDILRKALQDKSETVRMKAVVAIANLAASSKNTEALEILNDLIHDANPEIREFVIDELGIIGNKNSVILLLQALETAQDIEKELISESLNIILSKALA